jgi:hypothetical protein
MHHLLARIIVSGFAPALRAGCRGEASKIFAPGDIDLGIHLTLAARGKSGLP